MYVVTGNTYPARNMLKKAGFKWDAVRRAWIGGEAEMEELKRISRPVYSGKNASAYAGLKIEKIN